MEQDNKLYWVYGNTQPLLIPLEKEVMTEQEEIVAEPYYPDGEAVVTVNLVSHFKKYSYTPVVNGNLLTITDNGTLPCGCYGVEILIDNPDGTHERSEWDCQVVVTKDNVRTLQEWDEFKEQDIKARAAVFFFAKGDPFTYEDFTPEEIEDLKRPAKEAAAEVALLEQRIEAAEAQRVQAEGQRQQTFDDDHNRAAEDHQTAADDHANEQQRIENEQQRVENEQGRVNAETLREETFATYQPQIDAKLDKVTEAQFNEIFT